MRTFWHFIGILAMASLGMASEPSRKPNIVIILSDDYGWGSVGCYGAPAEIKTPNIDRLAQQGRRFTQAYAPGSVCSPTRYAMMTGRYYWRTPIKNGKVLPVNAPLHIETTRLTLASLCKGQGYRTAAFGKWHLGMTTEPVTDWSKPLRPGPLQVGFDHYFGMAANLGNGPSSFILDEEVTGRIAGQPIYISGGSTTEMPRTTGIGKAWERDQVMKTVTTHVTDWIQANHDQPFFLYFAPNAVHEPIVPNPDVTGSPYGKYGDFIQELDWSVGQVLAKLDQLKLADNTLVIFTSDNGGVLSMNSRYAPKAPHPPLSVNGSLRGGKHSEWEGGFREPFIVRWPGKVPVHTVSDQVICHVDMVATFASVLHAPLPKGNAEDSFDVLRAFTEAQPGPPVRDHVLLQSADAVYDIRMGNWKLVERTSKSESALKRRNRKRAEAGGDDTANADATHDELYNLKDDPAETQDVAAANPELVTRMKKVLIEARDRGYTRPGAGQ